MFSPWKAVINALKARWGGTAVRPPFRRQRRPELEQLEDRLAPATFTVTGTLDGAGTLTLVDAANKVYETTSLRRAIDEANNLAGVDTINFKIAGAARFTPATVLPTVTDAVVIDGTTQPDYDNVNFLPSVTIDGKNVNAGNGLTVTADGSTIKGLTIVNFKGGAGIALVSALAGTNDVKGGSTTTIVNNLLGTDATNTAGLGNKTGLRIDGGKKNTVGGTTADTRNIISGNTEDGIVLVGKRASQVRLSPQENLIVGNYIGTNVAGTAALGNARDGIHIDGGASNTIKGNVISGNKVNGIYLTTNGNQDAPRFDDPLPIENLIIGNKIGTDAQGKSAVPNTTGVIGVIGAGINLAGASGNTIGGTNEDARNIISGNGNQGIRIANIGQFDPDNKIDNRLYSTGNVVIGNYIGTDVSGTKGLRNFFEGVEIADTGLNRVGGDAPGERNVISGNRTGVQIIGDKAIGNAVIGNYIGPSFKGESLIADADQTVGLRLSVEAAENLVRGNVISGNGEAGLELQIDATRNQIVANRIGTNPDGTAALAGVVVAQRIGILIASGAANNLIGPGDQDPAESRNLISGNRENGIELRDAGTSNNRINGNYIGTRADGATPLQNKKYGIYIHNSADNNSVNGNVISGNGQSGVAITKSQATLLQANWIGLDQSGAVAAANGQQGLADGHGVLLDNASKITAVGNFISGNKQAGVYVTGTDATRNNIAGNVIGANQDGTAAVGNRYGVVITDGASDNTVGGNTPFDQFRSDAGNLISGNRLSGVFIQGANTNFLYGNFIGVDKDAIHKLGNGADNAADSHGVYLLNAFANRIGGAESRGNIIAGNAGDGLRMEDDDSTVNQVVNNVIGLGRANFLGERPTLANGGNGITIRGAAANTIGAPGLGNLISANTGDGIAIQGFNGFPGSDNTVQYNKIGTNSSGANDPAQRAPNRNGVFIDEGATGNTVYRNTIAFNTQAGVRDKNAPDSNTFSENMIFENGKLGIDVSAEGVTNVNVPVVTSAVVDKNNMLTVKCKLAAANANDTFTVEIFGNTKCDPSMWGEGEFFVIARANVAGDNKEFTAAIAYDPRWKHITATATKPGSGTGEFYQCLEVDHGPQAQADVFKTRQGVALTVPAPGVLQNDTDPDGDPLVASLRTGPANGTVAFNSDGSFTYTPHAAYIGTDSFTYAVADGRGGEDIATVTIDVLQPLKVVAARYRSFANTGGNEIYLGQGDLGVGANRTERGFTWQQSQGVGTYFVTFTYDAGARSLTTEVTPVGATPGSGTSLTYTNFLSSQPGFMDSFEILVADRDANSQVDFLNVRLDSRTLGDFIGLNNVRSTAFYDTTLNDGFVFSGTVRISGAFSLSQELSRVEIMAGRNLAFPPLPQPLMASTLGTTANAATLTQDQVQPLLAEALRRWAQAGAASGLIGPLDLHIVDLPGAELGAATDHTIWLDINAAGNGWFVAPTPRSDREFVRRGDQGEQGRIDLLSVLGHEVGHVLGFGHDSQLAMMAETLTTGTRTLFPLRDSAWHAFWRDSVGDAPHYHAALGRARGQ